MLNKYLKCAQSIPKSQAFPSQVCRKASKNALHSLAQGIKPFSPLLPSHCLCHALLCACLCFKTPLGSCLGSPFSPLELVAWFPQELPVGIAPLSHHQKFRSRAPAAAMNLSPKLRCA